MVTSLLLLLICADGNLPAANQLIEKAISLRKTQEARDLKFTYREEEERKDEKGKPEHPFLKTYDVIMLEGDNYRKLILEDGQPLDAKTAKKVQQDLEKTRAERQKQKFFHKGIPLGDLESLGRLFDSKVTGEEVIAGRKAWRVESEAKAGFKPARPGDDELLATRRVTWFDEEEGIDLRRDTTYIRNVHKIQAGAHGEIEFSKVGDAWLPAATSFHGEVHFLPGITGFGDIHSRFYDYKRFSAESTFTPN